MNSDVPINFRQFYEQFYAADHDKLTTAQEVRVILSAFTDYRRSLNMRLSPIDSAESDLLLGRLIYHNGALDAAESADAGVMEEQHWNALMDAWKLYLYALYSDDACNPGRFAHMGLGQRLKLWWRRSLVPLDPPPVLPRRAWTMVWAVDEIYDRQMEVAGNSAHKDRSFR